MKRSRMFLAMAFVLVVTPFVMGLGTISLTVTPNPGMAASKLQGNGTWGVGVKEKMSSVQFQATLKNSVPIQITIANATTAGGTWTSTLTVAAGTYNPCKATLFYVDAGGMAQQVSANNAIDQVVK